MTEIERVEARGRKGFPRRKAPSIEAIASYWADRCLKCDVPARGCGFVLDGHAIYLTFCDEDEPACVRCGMFLGLTSHLIRHLHGSCRPCKFTDDDPDCPCGAPAECQEYPRVKADKAHIVARWQADFGDAVDIAPEDIDKPANIALLCHECHRKDPEPATRREHLDWMCAERDRQAKASAALREFLRSNGDQDCPILHSLVFASLPDGHSRRAEAADEFIAYHRQMEARLAGRPA
jgi:hypothetical protein